MSFVTIWVLSHFDFSSFGALQNTKAAGYTGDVLLEIPTTSVAGQEYVVWCEWIKYYD